MFNFNLRTKPKPRQAEPYVLFDGVPLDRWRANEYPRQVVLAQIGALIVELGLYRGQRARLADDGYEAEAERMDRLFIEFTERTLSYWRAVMARRFGPEARYTLTDAGIAAIEEAGA